jgi:hypothetical protein
MDASLSQQLSLAACAMSAAALFFSLVAAFPGLKTVLAAVRDGTLWFSFFLVLGAGGFLAWQQVASDQSAPAAVPPPPTTDLGAYSQPQTGR